MITLLIAGLLVLWIVKMLLLAIGKEITSENHILDSEV